MPVYIPQEILDKIIAYAAADSSPSRYSEDFSSSASFVSHTFHKIVLPYKFRSLKFEFHERESYSFWHVPIPKFLRQSILEMHMPFLLHHLYRN